MAQAITSAPSHLVSCGIEPGALPPSSELFASRLTAESTLETFLACCGFGYTQEMSSPVTAETSCSRLSEYLAWGQLSLREIVQATRNRTAEFVGAKDLFMQKLEDEPRIE